MSKRSRSQRHKGSTKKPSTGLYYSTFSVPPQDHDTFKAALLSSSNSGVNEFPKRIADIQRYFRDSDPLHITSTFSFYGLQSTVNEGGVAPNSMLKHIQQYHAEFLQAIMLTVPSNEWGRRTVIPSVMQSLFDSVPPATRTFFQQRMLAMEKVQDEQEKMVLSLQDLIRFHTMGIRNWGYYSDVVKISLDLYGSLDADLLKHFGFSSTNLIHILDSIMIEFGRRSNDRFAILRKIARGKNGPQIIRLYFKHVPDLQGTPEEIIASVPSGITRQHAMALVMSHFDIHLSQLSTFSIGDVSNFSNIPQDTVGKVLEAISLPPGALVGNNPEHLFLSNPIWTAPGVIVSNGFFMPMPQVAFSHIHGLMHRLSTEARLNSKLEKNRSRYLESKLEEVLRKGFPGASFNFNAHWTVDGQRFETDAIVVLDRSVLIAEAKSHRLTPQGLRGAPDRVKRHIQDLVYDPSLQSARLENLIIAAREGDTKADTLVRGLGINPSQADNIVRLSITLDDLSVLSSLERNLKEVGWIPSDHQLAPTIGLADLICIVDILDSPLLLFHYFMERTYFQKSFEVIGDELDFLGLYLKNGLNFGDFEDGENRLVVTGMSSAIDHYYNSRDAGVIVTKPKVQLRPLFAEIIDQLSERRPQNWTTIGMQLLSCADYDQQKIITNQLNKLKKIVSKTYRDPQHLSTIQVHPPNSRKAKVIFYLYPDKLRSGRKQAIEAFGSEAIEETICDKCVIFGRCIDQWSLPYEVVCLVKRDDQSRRN